ncbi:MAG: zf-HC2 domain-containing protein [Phycisphaerales bacterium]|nr:zf-HC2 domain-containing protein [Phycisphaerales bacterium]
MSSGETTTCADVESLLAELLGGELDAPSRTRIEAHMARCEACRVRAARLQGARDLIAASSGGAASADLATRALTMPTAPIRGKLRPARWLAAAAVLGLMFAVGFAAGRGSRPAAAPGPAAPLTEKPPMADRPAFAQRYAEAAREFPRSGSMAWALTSLARRK